jgi:hypothetical protein
MGFCPISMWTSATSGVAESHKINAQFTCLRQFIIEVVYFISHKREPIASVQHIRKRYANLFNYRI